MVRRRRAANDPSKKAGLFGRALTAAVSTVLAGVLLEALLFAFEPSLARTFQYDEELGFRVKPYAGESNRHGFNDRDYDVARAAGVVRILIIGDSFGWMGGRERNYTAILERLFEQTYGRHRVDVINAGYSMTSAPEQARILRRDGMPYRPDLVILGFFAGNDFVDSDPTRLRIATMDTYFDVDARNPPSTFFGRPLIARSRLWTTIDQRVTLVRAILDGRADDDGLQDEAAYFTMAGAQMHFFNTRKHQAGDFAPHVAHTLGAIDAMDAMVRAAGAEFRVAIYPAAYSVDAELAGRIFERLGLDPDDHDLSLAQSLLVRHLESRGIRHWDLTAEFAARSMHHPLYLPLDGHWNAAGNEAAAAFLHRQLVAWTADRLVRVP